MFCWMDVLRVSQILHRVFRSPTFHDSRSGCPSSGLLSLGGEASFPSTYSHVWSNAILILVDHKVQPSRFSSLSMARMALSMAESFGREGGNDIIVLQSCIQNSGAANQNTAALREQRGSAGQAYTLQR